jgi:hypothetical protein
MKPRAYSIALAASLSSALIGCAGIPTEPARQDEELISYETSPGPFCGRCDTIKIVATSDGRVWIEQGHWAGNYSDWQTRRRYPRVTPARFARFQARLAPHRPVGLHDMTDPDNCTEFWHDMSEVSVRWKGGGADGTLRFYFGCDPDLNAALTEALQAAPAELAIRELKIPGNNWVATSRR